MSSSTTHDKTARARRVDVTDEALVVELVDQRKISVPLSWYPRLAHGSPTERARWELIGDGRGIHWPDLDEDISVAGLVDGGASNESDASIKRWLESRQKNAG